MYVNIVQIVEKVTASNLHQLIDWIEIVVNGLSIDKVITIILIAKATKYYSDALTAPDYFVWSGNNCHRK